MLMMNFNAATGTTGLMTGGIGYVLRYLAAMKNASASYPVALLTGYAPEALIQILDEAGILHSELVEPMCCDEEILRKYVPGRIVFDESFMDNCNFSFDDERFFWICQKLDTGQQSYIDAGSFTMAEIR